MRVFIVSFVLFLSVWMIDFSSPIYDHYIVYLHSDFSKAQGLVVLQSMDEWSDTTGVKFDFIISDEVKFPTKNQVVIQSIPSEHDCSKYSLFTINCVALTNTHFIVGGSTIYVPSNLDDETFNNIVLHELGHAIGLDHINRLDAMMYPYYGYAKHLSCWDIQEYYRLRGKSWACYEQQ